MSRNLFGSMLTIYFFLQMHALIATEPYLSNFMFAFSQVHSLRIAEKLSSFSAEVIGNVHVIFNRTNKLRNLFPSHFLTAFVNICGRHLEAITNHFRCQSRSFWSTKSPLREKCPYSEFFGPYFPASYLRFGMHQTSIVRPWSFCVIPATGCSNPYKAIIPITNSNFVNEFKNWVASTLLLASHSLV